ncbi:hypothetical protein TNCV_840571 [Trichonephila clavipes]|nr:hypothetical protein TNCV_840571 [Trichonephila clavipes]
MRFFMKKGGNGNNCSLSKEVATTISAVSIIWGPQATRGLLATDHVILSHGQVTWTIPELAPPLLTTTPHQREDVSTDITCIAALHGKTADALSYEVLTNSQSFLILYYGNLKKEIQTQVSFTLHLYVAQNYVLLLCPVGAGKPVPSPFELSVYKCHKPDLDHQTTVPGKCPSSSEDE